MKIRACQVIAAAALALAACKIFESSMTSMRRSLLLALLLSLFSFVVVDYSFHVVAMWLSDTEYPLIFAFFGQLGVFFPFVVCGVVAGHWATPRGFPVGFLAGLVGALWACTWNYQSAWSVILSSDLNTASAVGWSLGAAIAS